MKKKIIFIGNSIVAGYPWNKGKSFPSRVRHAMGDACTVINKGVNGDTTQGILARFETDVIAHNPDIVFILTGTNDFIYRDLTPNEAFQNLRMMAEIAKSNDCEPVFLTPLLVDESKAECMWMVGMGISYPAVNRDVNEFSELIKASGYDFVDLNAEFRHYVAENFSDSPEDAYLDGLHPMPAGQEYIGDLIVSYLKNKFGEE